MLETENTTKLIKYEAARQALIEAKSIDEVKQIKDKSEALRHYAKQSKDIDMANWAAEIRIRAERRMGEMLREQDKNKGGTAEKESYPSHDASSRTPTLKEVGITHSESSRAQKIASVPEDEFEAVIAEHKEKSIELTSATVRRLTASKEKEKVINAIKSGEIKAPEGLYDVIVLDPPWQMEKIDRDVAPNQVGFDYPTMDESQLEVINVPFNESCHVFMWTTHKHLPMALRLFEKWSVKYVLTMVWHKNGGFQPFGLPQYNCEFVLYGRIGTPIFVDTKAFPVCFSAPRRGHSEKPKEFYDLIRRVAGGRRLDMFNRRDIDGFDVWGNESGNT